MNLIRETVCHITPDIHITRTGYYFRGSGYSWCRGCLVTDCQPIIRSCGTIKTPAIGVSSVIRILRSRGEMPCVRFPYHRFRKVNGRCYGTDYAPASPTVIITVGVSVLPLSSFTVAVSVASPAAVGVPVIAPLASTDNPAAPEPESA